MRRAVSGLRYAAPLTWPSVPSCGTVNVLADTRRSVPECVRRMSRA